MEKEILKRGYITHALTNENDEIYGMIAEHSINWELNEIEKAHSFYWSEVYCEPGYMAKIIRKGTSLIDATPEELDKYFEQSKVNLN